MEKQCKVQGCQLDTPRIIAGYCQVHYNRVRRTGEVGSTYKRGQIKSFCCVENCNETATPSGACRKHWHNIMQPDRAKGQSLLRHGLNKESYTRILLSQENSCAICKTNTPDLIGRWTYFVVDHDHTCCPGRYSCGNCIRGLICDRCNLVLGKVKDDILLLQSMINYIDNPDEGLV